MKKYKIVFVCLGNICRSPMAEFICKHLYKTKFNNLDLSICSAGTSGWHDGQDVHNKTKQMLIKNKIECSGFASQKITKEMFDNNDFIIVMDDSNLINVNKMFNNTNKNKVFKITDYSNGKYDFVEDPWYTDNFQKVYDILTISIINFLNNLK